MHVFYYLCSLVFGVPGSSKQQYLKGDTALSKTYSRSSNRSTNGPDKSLPLYLISTDDRKLV